METYYKPEDYINTNHYGIFISAQTVRYTHSETLYPEGASAFRTFP